MKNRVTVMVPDQAICVDDEWLNFAFSAAKNVRVIQWHKKGEQHIEYADGRENVPIADYANEVAPFVTLFEAEKQRLIELHNTPLTAEEEAAQRRAEVTGELAKLDSDSIRPLRALQVGTGTEEDERHLREIEERIALLRADLAGL